MMLPAPAATPPTKLLDAASWIKTAAAFGSGVLPSAAVPKRLPTTCVLVEWSILTPVSRPDTRLPAPGMVPPIVAPTAWKTMMAVDVPGMAAVASGGVAGELAWRIGGGPGGGRGR